MSSQPGDPPATRRQNAASNSVLRQILGNRGFLVCAMLLLACTAAFEVMARTKGLQFRKDEVPLRKPLNLLDQSALRRPLFATDGSLGSRLYDGPATPALISAFGQHGFPLSTDAKVEVTQRGQQWLVTDRNPKTDSEDRYALENDRASKQLEVFGQYRLLSAVEIKPEILDQLGTKQYIQWVLLDPSSVKGMHPEDLIQLFVTYYTGSPDQVPHVPEECYMGGGFTKNDEFLVDVPVPGLGPDEVVQVKALQFDGPSYISVGSKIVMYVFHTNGRFCADRNCVRNVMADPFERHAYFSKLEVTFGTDESLPTREKAVEAGKRFMAIVIPLLVKDHWPDWDQVLRSERHDKDQNAEQPSGK